MEITKTKDELIDELLLKVEEKKAEIERIKNPVFITNLSLPADFLGISGGPLNRVNLNVASENTLVSILVWLENMIQNNSLVGEKYSINGISEWFGFKLEDWRDDVVLKIKQNQSNKQIRELKEIEGTLKTLMSDDKKKVIQLQELMSKLGL